MTGLQAIPATRGARPARRGPRLALGVAALRVAALGVAALGVSAPARLAAQKPEGAAELLLPYAPVVVGTQASIAAPTGLYGIWSNPAAVADVRASTGALLGGTLLESNFLGLAGATGSRLLGSAALAATVVDYGSQPATDINTGVEIGTIYIRRINLSATYGVSLTQRLSAGLSLKLFQERTDCTGQCTASNSESRGTAYPIDAGVRYLVRADSTLTVAAAVRNMGGAIQSNDAEQADPLPTRIVVGAHWNPAALQVPASGVAVSLTADASRAVVNDALTAAGGVEVRLRDQFVFRAGMSRGDIAVSGAAIGLSVRQGSRLTIDFARYVSGQAVDVGSAPTSISIAARF
jgi:hypothetical protein